MLYRRPAAHLVAFDLFIDNPDRRIGNANAFLTKDSIVAFDHEQAFSFIWPDLLRRDPAEPHLAMLNQHAFAGLVRRRTSVKLEDFRRELGHLDDSRLKAIAEATPRNWQTGPAAGKLDVIIANLTKRRDAASTWLGALESWMQT